MHTSLPPQGAPEPPKPDATPRTLAVTPRPIGLRLSWRARWLGRLGGWLDSFEVRTLLSILILLSVLPTATLEAILPSALWPHRRLIFLSVFVPEFICRLLLFNRRRRQGRLGKGESMLLLLDLLAILSFFPWVTDAAYLRFFRLTRLLLLFGYWRHLAHQLWLLMVQRERRFQVLLVLILGMMLSLASTVLLVEMRAQHDFNGDGAVDGRDQDFLDILWWSFRQVQDPGNLVPEVRDGFLVLISLFLTFTGLLLFSFLIGIGTTVVSELVERSRSQRVGMHDHTVILGMPPYSAILLHELTQIYRKNLRTFQAAVLALDLPEDIRTQAGLRGFRFRRGSPTDTSDLDRVDVRYAKRVIILGDESADPDASVVSAVLAVRERTATAQLYPDIEHERNFPALRTAGGGAIDLIGSGPFLGYYLAQNVAYPGVYRLYRHLLTSVGCEIYTYFFSDGERQRFRAQAKNGGISLLGLHRESQDQGITLLGLFTAPDAEHHYSPEEMDLLVHPLRRMQRGEEHYALDDQGRLLPSQVRGIAGIALRFSDLVRLAHRLVSRGVTFHGREPEAPTPPRWGPQLTLAPARRPIRRVLILGAGPRAPRVIRELVGFSHQVEITVLARQREPMAVFAHDAQTMLAEAFGETSERPEVDGDVIRLHLETPSILAKVTFMVADWTHRHVLEDEGAVTLSQADAILVLLGSDRSLDRDGSIALDCLHLANLERTAAVRLKAGVHIVAMLQDPDKGELLESRLMGMKGEGSTSRYTVVSRAMTRHRFIMQSVFVPGINKLYLELLSSRGQYLSRLLARDLAGEALAGGFDPLALADELLFEHGLIFVGLEFFQPDADGELVVVDPKRWQPLHDVAWDSVAAVFVLGDGKDLEAVQGTAFSEG